jgi:hypothetical protein
MSYKPRSSSSGGTVTSTATITDSTDKRFVTDVQKESINTALQPEDVGSIASHDTSEFEPALGNPASNGYVLSSTTGGSRSWIASSGGGLSGDGINFVVVTATDDATTNGTNLRSAYTAAAALTPNGSAKSATNRSTLIVTPGNYDLGTTPLTMDTEFVDLFGLTNNPEQVLITSAVSSDNSGTLVQTADNVIISGVTLKNTQNSNSANDDSTDPAAYAPSSNLSSTIIRKVIFTASNNGRAMRNGVIYSGRYEDCVIPSGVYYGFGSFGGEASGTFIRCSAYSNAFGFFCDASGVFEDCYCFNAGFGCLGDITGTMRNCRVSSTSSFGYASSESTGTLINCESAGSDGSQYSFDNLKGHLFNCRCFGKGFLFIQKAFMFNCSTFGSEAISSIDTSTITMTIASPCVVTHNNHGLAVGKLLRFTSSGSLPTGVTSGNYYKILEVIDSNSYKLDDGTGAELNTSGSQSGTHTVKIGARINCIDKTATLLNS